MAKIPLFQVDSFTKEKFKGNPAGVCMTETALSEIQMQNIAMEMNLSETAFLFPESDGYRLRWFTPEAEVKLCGHATLASTHILFENNYLSKDKIANFYTLSGLLTAKMSDGLIELDFPAKLEEPVFDFPEIEGIIKQKPVYLGKNEFDYLVEVESEEMVRLLEIDIQKLKSLPVRGLIVTAKSSDPSIDFVSRFFAPAVGVNEDPVTGSAHCCLAPYWMKKSGKTEFNAYQASKRGGFLKLRVEGNRVKIMGNAVTVFGTELTL